VVNFSKGKFLILNSLLVISFILPLNYAPISDEKKSSFKSEDLILESKTKKIKIIDEINSLISFLSKKQANEIIKVEKLDEFKISWIAPVTKKEYSSNIIKSRIRLLVRDLKSVESWLKKLKAQKARGWFWII